jgi:mycobactin lysine-N-oxygenase
MYSLQYPQINEAYYNDRWFLQSLEIINPDGTIYSRGESFVENIRFSNPEFPDPWVEENRREFIDRTDRGVFSIQSKSVLDRAENVMPRTGRVSKLRASEAQVLLDVEYSGKINLIPMIMLRLR